MTAEPRHEVLGLQLGAGDHICGFYRKPAERDDILIPFLVEGLKAGDKCTCVVDSCTPDDVLAKMSEQIEVGPVINGARFVVFARAPVDRIMIGEKGADHVRGSALLPPANVPVYVAADWQAAQR